MLSLAKIKKRVNLKSEIEKRVNTIKKDLYLKEVVKYIDEQGYKKFKISELAKKLEVSVGTIYNIFISKENLYLEYLILKLENFLLELETKQTKDPIENLKLYLNLKYKIFLHIDKNNTDPIANDPFFFPKLDIINHPVVIKIHKFLSTQFDNIYKDKDIDVIHLTILFKNLSDGYIESYLTKKFETENIVDKTINTFFNGINEFEK